MIRKSHKWRNKCVIIGDNVSHHLFLGLQVIPSVHVLCLKRRLLSVDSVIRIASFCKKSTNFS